jgi:hypothetical protein
MDKNIPQMFPYTEYFGFPVCVFQNEFGFPAGAPIYTEGPGEVPAWGSVGRMTFVKNAHARHPASSFAYHGGLGAPWQSRDSEDWRYEKTAASTSGGWSHSGKTCFPEAAPTRACRRTPSPPP